MSPDVVTLCLSPPLWPKPPFPHLETGRGGACPAGPPREQDQRAEARRRQRLTHGPVVTGSEGSGADSLSVAVTRKHPSLSGPLRRRLCTP